MDIRIKKLLFVIVGCFVFYMYLYYPIYVYRFEGSLERLSIQSKCRYVSMIGPDFVGGGNTAQYGCELFYYDEGYEGVRQEIKRMDEVLKDSGWIQTEQIGYVDSNHYYNATYRKKAALAKFYINIQTTEAIDGPDKGRVQIHLIYSGNFAL